MRTATGRTQLQSLVDPSVKHESRKRLRGPRLESEKTFGSGSSQKWRPGTRLHIKCVNNSDLPAHACDLGGLQNERRVRAHSSHRFVCISSSRRAVFYTFHGSLRSSPPLASRSSETMRERKMATGGQVCALPLSSRTSRTARGGWLELPASQVTSVDGERGRR